MSHGRRDESERLAESEQIERREERDGESGSRKEADTPEGERHEEDALNGLYHRGRWQTETEHMKKRDWHPERIGNAGPDGEIPRQVRPKKKPGNEQSTKSEILGPPGPEPELGPNLHRATHGAPMTSKMRTRCRSDGPRSVASLMERVSGFE